jgi:hypothetical protein
MSNKSIEVSLNDYKGLREAGMNLGAVDKAKVYHGGVHYFSGRLIDLPNTTLVEVGKKTVEGGEHSKEDHTDTAGVARLLGFELEWIPYNEAGDRKLFIGGGFNENNEIVSLTEEQATKIAGAINKVYKLAKNLQADLLGASKHT